MVTLRLKFDECKSAPDFAEIYDFFVLDYDAQIRIEPADWDANIPMPWDAELGSQDGKIILYGYLQPGGGDLDNVCEVKVNTEDFDQYYKVFVDLDESFDDAEALEREEMFDDFLGRYGIYYEWV